MRANHFFVDKISASVTKIRSYDNLGGGLMAFPVVDKNQKYTVVTYWVE